MTTSDGNATSTKSAEKKDDQKLNQDIKQKKIQRPDQEEIDKHLHELNLATDVKLKRQREEWFRENHISILQYQSYYYLVPEGVENYKEVIEHLHYANIHVLMLADHLDWLRKNGTTVQLKKVGLVKKYVFVKQEKIEKIDQKQQVISDVPEHQKEVANSESQATTSQENKTHGEHNL